MSDTRLRALLATTLIVAVVLRFIALQSGLWYDEIVTLVASARNPLAQIVTEYPALNAHPLYSVLAHASMVTFGESAWSLRLPACVLGIMSVVMVYLLGSRLTNSIEAWAGVAVLTTSYHHIWFSQNARGYTLMGFLTLAATFLLLRIYQHDRRSDYVLYALTAAAGVYTHLTMVFVIVGHALAVVGGQMIGWAPANRRSIRPFLWMFAAAALLSVLEYAPFISSVLEKMTAEAPRKAAEVATASWALGETIRSVLVGAGVPAAIVGGVFAVAGGVSLWRRQPLAIALLIMPAVVTVAGIVVLGQPLRPRFLFFLSGAAAVFVGRGIGAAVEAATSFKVLSRDSSTAAIAACTLLLAAASAVALPYNYRVPKQDFDGAVRFLAVEETGGAEIVAAGPACLPFERYYGKTWRCLTTPDDWRRVQSTRSRVLVAYTLAEHIEDAALRSMVRSDCSPVHVFPGSLGQGDITVCEARKARP